MTAVALSALPAGRFTFEGFLSTSGRSRAEHLEELKGERRTMVFYEAPHKIAKTLADLAAALGAGREVSLCRELTKMHEEVIRTTLGEAAERYAAEPPRGEFVLVVAGAPEPARPQMDEQAALELVRRYRAEGLSLKDAAKKAAAESGFSRNELYSAALKEECPKLRLDADALRAAPLSASPGLPCRAGEAAARRKFAHLTKETQPLAPERDGSRSSFQNRARGASDLFLLGCRPARVRRPLYMQLTFPYLFFNANLIIMR